MIEATHEDEVVQEHTYTKGICFYVTMEYNERHPNVREKISKKALHVESGALKTYNEATDFAEALASKTSKEFSGASAEVVEDDEGGTSLVVTDETGIISSLMIIMDDYREETLH